MTTKFDQTISESLPWGDRPIEKLDSEYISGMIDYLKNRSIPDDVISILMKDYNGLMEREKDAGFDIEKTGQVLVVRAMQLGLVN